MDPEAVEAIRALIPDDAPIYGDNRDEYLFTDEQIIRIYGTVGNQSIVRTTGFFCISVGNSEALISKVIKTTDLSTNGAALQQQWGARGEYYIGLADAEGTVANATFFQIIDYRQGWTPEADELTEWAADNS